MHKEYAYSVLLIQGLMPELLAETFGCQATTTTYYTRPHVSCDDNQAASCHGYFWQYCSKSMDHPE